MWITCEDEIYLKLITDVNIFFSTQDKMSGIFYKRGIRLDQSQYVSGGSLCIDRENMKDKIDLGEN